MYEKMCERCKEKPVTRRVEFVYLGAPGFDETRYLCEQCASDEIFDFLEARNEHRISWQWVYREYVRDGDKWVEVD
jgi:protein-arginine kinase activator protein McsA